MKILLTLTICLLSSFALLGQIPQAFNYQAAVRNSAGEIQFETDANFRIEILQNGTSIYSENHPDKNTGKTGVVNFKVGLGIDAIGDFFSIDWGQGDLEIRVHLQLDSGQEEEMGTSDIVAVPFALYSNKSGDSYWEKENNNIFYTDGKVGINTSTPNANLHIRGEPDVTLEGGGGLLIGSITGDNIVIDRNELMAREGGEIAKLNLQAEGGEISVHSVEAEISQFVVKNDGKVGIGINDPVQRLHLRTSNGDAQIRLERTGNNAGHSTIGGNGEGFVVGHFNGSGDFERDLIVNHGGMAEVNCLKITGGCDIKEDLNSIEKLEAGDIVVIDENNPGNVRRTNEEYDRKVAGIISGANGINPGLSLSQDDVLEGEFPLTMLGRVYVKVTGMVEIGDMLTTSSKSGFAMSVKDFSRAHGTVIGKAMTSNESGEGLVLVLVNLQ